MAQLEVGDVLEHRYRIDRPIAKGGMSTVYRCVDLRLGRALAAKVMHDQYSQDEVFIHRFHREARAMAQLMHPNLVNVYDFSAEGDPVFLIMELITGGTLRELTAERGPMPPHAALSVMRSVLTGLSAVHDKGLVHRDIKPDNVLIHGDHTVKLADFGLVRATSSHTVTSNQIVGTVSYLSPEQVTGAHITAASDVYSAGIVLFELLTGAVPFSGNTPLGHAMARLDADVPSPSSKIAGVPPLVDALVATATSSDVSERFADAREFLDALDDVAEELNLPTYLVPIPHNSAAARTAAAPTNMDGIDSAGVFEPTGFIDTSEPATEVFGEAIAEETRVEPAGPYNPPHREPLSFETRFDGPDTVGNQHADVPTQDRPRETPGIPKPAAGLAGGAAAGGGLAGGAAAGGGLAGGAGAAGASTAGSAASGAAAGAQRYPDHVRPGIQGPETRITPSPHHDAVEHQQHNSLQERDSQRPTTAEPEPQLRPLSNRSPITFIAWLVLVGIIVAGVGLAGWWFGSGYYGNTPWFIR
ncbi:protein kinase [Corynebacterium sp. L4756]|uniref:protein kinase domain-containing protein n=1 Tax=unclassified Corynebacterium TaxID=2624378 RepID=UPI00374DE752